jgi:hypothetical protein
MKPDQDRLPASAAQPESWALNEILRAIKGVRFGSIEITIHDSRVVQIERKEKVRFGPIPRTRTD